MALRFKTEGRFKDHEIDCAELEIHKGLMAGYVYYQNIAAAAANNAATQKSLAAAATGAMASPLQPDIPRNIKMTVTDANDSITSLQVTVLGKDVLGRTLSEVFTIAAAGVGKVQTGTKIFAKLTSITVDTNVGGGTGDTLDMGWQNLLGVPAVGKNFAIVKLVSGGTEEDAAAESEDGIGQCYFTPTTVPDAAVDYEVWFTFSPRIFEEASQYNVY